MKTQTGSFDFGVADDGAHTLAKRQSSAWVVDGNTVLMPKQKG